MLLVQHWALLLQSCLCESRTGCWCCSAFPVAKGEKDCWDLAMFVTVLVGCLESSMWLSVSVTFTQSRAKETETWRTWPCNFPIGINQYKQEGEFSSDGSQCSSVGFSKAVPICSSWGLSSCSHPSLSDDLTSFLKHKSPVSGLGCWLMCLNWRLVSSHVTSTLKKIHKWG